MNFPKDEENIAYVMVTDIFITGVIGTILALLNDIEKVVRIGGLWEYPKNEPKFILSEIFKFFSIPFVIKNSKNIVTNTRHIKKRVSRDNKKIKVIYNGVDTELFSPKNRSNPNDNQKLKVIFVGSLNKNKGVHLLVEVADKLKEDFKFTFLGKGPLEKKLVNTILL